MKIIKTSRTITADDEPLSVSDALRRYIKQNLTDDICIETVSLKTMSLWNLMCSFLMFWLMMIPVILP